MRKRALLIGGLTVLALVQLVPVDRGNPPVAGEVPAPEDVRGLLREACYDCHSHATRWPWYAYVAPVSWWIAHDVNHAREHMNFSTWNAYADDERADHFEEIQEELEDGAMPPAAYTVLHGNARLSESETRTLLGWARAEEARAAAGSEPPPS